MITDCLNRYQLIQTNQSLKKLYHESCLSSVILMEYNRASYSKTIVNGNFNGQHYDITFMKLRGGGCGKSKAQNNLDSQLQKNQNPIISQQLPENYLVNLNDYLKVMVDEAPLICDTTKRNELMKRIQWFIYNREHLNYLCNDEKVVGNIYDLAKGNYESLLTVLITYLRSSGFICYQVLQICNELLRIMYIFQYRESKRFLKDEDKQDYIQKLSEFETQLEIEQANVWKTGFEFEIKIMKIMIMNSKTDSTEGKDALINFFKEAGKSIISLSPSEDLPSTIIEGGKYLLKKGIEKKIYPIETYQIYYLFQLIKWSIIKQLKSKNSVYKQIQQLKDVFQQHILVSDNWILHFCWIQMIMDIIAYRPIINKSNISMKLPNQQLIIWNLLIENNLIHCVSYNKNEAIMNLFQDQQKQIYDIELTNQLDLYGKKKFELFSQFLLKGDLTQNLNQWDHYKEFTFKKQKDKKQEDYEIILASYEVEIMQKIINNIKSQQDELLSIHSGIIQSFQTYFKEPLQMSIQIIQDDQQASQKQFLQTYKQLIILSNYFKELSKFEVTKLNLLNPYLEYFKNQENLKNLTDLKVKIDNFNKTELIDYIKQLLNSLLIAIEFSSCINEMNLFLDSKDKTDLEKLIKKFEIYKLQEFFTIFENQFNQFTLNLRSYKENFLKFIQKEEGIKSMTIQIKEQNILSIIEYKQDGEQNLNKRLQEIFIHKHKSFDSELITLENVQQNLIDCKFIIITLQFLKQFINIQSQYLTVIKQKLKNGNKNQDSEREVIVWNKKQNIYKIEMQFELQYGIKLNSILFSKDKELICCTNTFAYKSTTFKAIRKKQCIETQISPQGNIAAVIYEKQLSIIDINTQDVKGSIQFDLQPNKIQFSKDCSKLALFLDYDKEVRQFMILDSSTLTTICLIPFWNKYWVNYILSNNFEKLYIQYDDSQQYVHRDYV